eukprot:TRINITY_DN4714_c2_g1_i1.p1 TRINITY_DN4714_c2_g1~~TRINITY_DN4714_c2_g1_i1.p1  ORF type:complete len:907 (+),score=424.30 TRINITY_DN4714_c2_g1_i1:69-2723(+)
MAAAGGGGEPAAPAPAPAPAAAASGKGKDDNNIRVIARFRPMNRLEKEEGGREVVQFSGDMQTTIEPTEAAAGSKDKHTFNFDHIFQPNCTQKAVYDQVGVSVVADVFKGYNGTIFVYGQTGSGKSHTMMGPSSDELRGYCDDDKLKGIIPRVVDQIFVNVERADQHVEFTIKVSYVEIYMEKVRDLFTPEKNNLQLHEDFKGGRGVFIADVTEEYVASPAEIFALMRQGASNRAVASTRMNADSSRSHSIFQINITQKHSVKLDTVTGKLFLVDLAGSEKVGKTKAEGQQLEEAKLINKSLSCLGLVINALTDRRSQHIPYRDSKLTRLLQDSLGGNARTSLIICCSVSEYNQAETLSTLRFGQRAKSIKNKAKVNRELSIAEYKLLVARLERNIADLQKGMGVAPIDAASVEALADLEVQLENERSRWLDEKTDLEDDLQEMREKESVRAQLLEQYRAEIASYQEEVQAWEDEYAELQAKAEELSAVAEKERRSNAEKVQAITGANSAIDLFAKDILGVKVTLQRLRTHLEQQGMVATAGGLDEASQQQAAGWRRDREAARQEDADFRLQLKEKIEGLGQVEARGARAREEEIRSLRGQLAQSGSVCWLRHCVDEGGSDESMPSGEDAMRAEIQSLRKACAALRSSDNVPRAAFDEAKSCFAKELASRDAELSRISREAGQQKHDMGQLRQSLLTDLQSRCERIIDLELSLEDTREQYQVLCIASSNKQQQKQIKQLEEQLSKQAELAGDLLMENSTVTAQLELANKKLDIRNSRIENLKQCLEDEKKQQMEQRQIRETERVKMKTEMVRLQATVQSLRDKLSRDDVRRAAQAVSKVTKVVRGGQRHDEKPRHADALAASVSSEAAAELEPAAPAAEGSGES